MKISFIGRGGIGDFCMFMTKFQSLRKLYKNDIINCYIVSPIAQSILDLFEYYSIFDSHNILLPYKQTITEYHIKKVKPFNKIYIFNVWQTDRKIVSIDKQFPLLESQYYIPFKDYYYLTEFERYKPFITIQMYGTSSLKKWGLNNWQQLTKQLYNLGYNIIILGNNNEDFSGLDYCINLNNQLSLKESISLVLNSVMFIGKDSGLKNVALLNNIPTIMIFDPSHICANPKETWFPEIYQKDPKNAIVNIDNTSDIVYFKAKEILKDFVCQKLD